MLKNYMDYSKLSPNLQTIAAFVPAGATMLDIGCAKGNLLLWLKENKGVQGRGIEIDNAKVQATIAQGLSVIQGNAEEDITHYPDNSYDYIILNGILQQMQNPVAMMQHAARVAKYIVISVPNFGHIRNRWYLALHGKMPVTRQLNYEWYETPNIHFCTLKDFDNFLNMLGLKVSKQIILTNPHLPQAMMKFNFVANLVGEKGVFLLQKK
jgi:methionine biosynthesis protein MetW